MGSDERLPPGQHWVRDFPVLHVGDVPYRTLPEDWNLRAFGAVERPQRWSFDDLKRAPSTFVSADLHCVTTWSKRDTSWRGVGGRWLLEQVRPTAEASHVLALAEGGYSANVPIEALQADEALLAYEYEGAPLEPEHGFPLRLLLPALYLWKSAKWLRGLEFLTEDRLGYWERYGYSNSGDPWGEKRYDF